MDDLTASQLQTAYELIKAGHPDPAREILIPLLRANPRLSEGWFLLGHAVSSPREKIRCFQRVLELDPTDQAAQKQLDRLRPPKKRSPVNFWGLAGLLGLLACLLGLGLVWSFNQPFLAGPEPTASLSQAGSVLPTKTLAPATLTPWPNLTPGATSRPTITLNPTSTAQPSVTVIPTSTPVPTATPLPPPKPKHYTGCLAPNGLGVLTSPFKIENFGKVRASVHLTGLSRNGNYPITCQASVKQGVPVMFTLVWGNYEYIVFRGSLIERGTFSITQEMKLTMRVFADKVQIGEFP
jgi:hypothetical protein